LALQIAAGSQAGGFTHARNNPGANVVAVIYQHGA
jgi:hypothetical protein